ncbi:low-molecular-weight cysteine-rich 47 [Arabidopsis thaliana]|uniref:Defensin-like protein 91 n=1 Tax=Arabidopsis thaliana TaxID=3702 RepID=DEF91_ARATH|nr:low-molecular-weight cysteine-rich 47 [Arabidopsis thaliana]P82762.1 RecName: Full=Defensin-like protein 91; AltName: Full=Low-molecular-weight cysteine-rich protein 47; Short=Protein LCR47; Flags: Precursor [Arabidopsis thaliana]AEE77735.1 low-molecular-weight cysteine-rich 47 [Arabidopsis thaliana]|eukprot:NP_001030800.2 low-molecular-weight cysteine-rich 47 [Arabidopsis thaliana]
METKKISYFLLPSLMIVALIFQPMCSAFTIAEPYIHPCMKGFCSFKSECANKCIFMGHHKGGDCIGGLDGIYCCCLA